MTVINNWHQDVLEILIQRQEAATCSEEAIAFSDAIETIRTLPITTEYYINEDVMEDNADVILVAERQTTH